MRKFLVFAGYLFGIIHFAPASHAAIIPQGDHTYVIQAVLEKIASYKIKKLQQIIGRNFTLKEKFSFWILKFQLKHSKNNSLAKRLVNNLINKKAISKRRTGNLEDTGTKGQTAFVFGFIAVGLLVAGLFIPYVILGSLVSAILAIAIGTVASKKDPSDGKARAGKLMGWITLGLIALLIILAVALISSWGW